jgi:hypothetical protein
MSPPRAPPCGEPEARAPIRLPAIWTIGRVVIGGGEHKIEIAGAVAAANERTSANEARSAA